MKAIWLPTLTLVTLLNHPSAFAAGRGAPQLAPKLDPKVVVNPLQSALPVMNYNQAEEYCKNQKGRLPTEEEGLDFARALPNSDHPILWTSGKAPNRSDSVAVGNGQVGTYSPQVELFVRCVVKARPHTSIQDAALEGRPFRVGRFPGLKL